MQFRTLEEIRHKTRHLVPKDLGSTTEGWPMCETASSCAPSPPASMGSYKSFQLRSSNKKLGEEIVPPHSHREGN